MRTSITSSTSGSQRFDVFSSSATLLPGQNAIATTSAITLTLPAATTTRSTRIANTSEAAITVSGGASTINGASTLSLDSGAIGEFYPQAGAWVAIGGAIGASRITTGLLDAARIPNLPASQLTSGVLDVARIPDLSANKITSDLIGTARLATGTANNTTFLRGDQTWQTINTGRVISLPNNPTSTTNPLINALVYAKTTDKLWFCKDNTSNFNIWRELQWGDESVGGVSRSYPGGTLTDDIGADTVPNKAIADADILWYIGTNGLTAGFTNPIDGTRIIQTNSGLLSGTPVRLADRLYGSTSSLIYHSSELAQSWFRLNFGSNTRISLTKIALQQRGDSTSNPFRTLSIRYSDDGITFTQAVSTTASNGLGDWHVFDVTGFPSSQHLEVQHTSVSGTGLNYFTAGELLLYGAIYYV